MDVFDCQASLRGHDSFTQVAVTHTLESIKWKAPRTPLDVMMHVNVAHVKWSLTGPLRHNMYQAPTSPYGEASPRPGCLCALRSQVEQTHLLMLAHHRTGSLV